MCLNLYLVIRRRFSLIIIIEMKLQNLGIMQFMYKKTQITRFIARNTHYFAANLHFTCPLIDINLARIIQIKFLKIVKTGTLHLFCADSGNASWPRLSPMQQIKKFYNLLFFTKKPQTWLCRWYKVKTKKFTDTV